MKEEKIQETLPDLPVLPSGNGEESGEKAPDIQSEAGKQKRRIPFPGRKKKGQAKEENSGTNLPEEKTEEPSGKKEGTARWPGYLVSYLAGVLSAAIIISGAAFYVMQDDALLRMLLQAQAGGNYTSTDPISVLPDSSLPIQWVDPAMTRDSYARADILWTGAFGYLLGEYVPVQDMPVYAEPLTVSEQVRTAREQEPVEITAIVTGLQDSVWGQTEKGDWLVLGNERDIYCLGPGEYRTDEQLAIFSENLETIGLISPSQEIFVTNLYLLAGRIYGILDDGNMIALYDYSLTVSRAVQPD